MYRDALIRPRYTMLSHGILRAEVRKASVWPAVATNAKTDTGALTMPRAAEAGGRQPCSVSAEFVLFSLRRWARK